jgi:hypothetical protein
VTIVKTSRLCKALPLLALAWLAACDSKNPATGAAAGAQVPAASVASAGDAPKAPESATVQPKSLSLATFCSATAQVLKNAKAADWSINDLEFIEASANQYAAQEAATKGLAANAVDQQTASVARLATRQITPADKSDEALRKAEAAARSLAQQLRTDCAAAFGKPK